MTDFSLRPWALADLHSLVKYANNPKIAQNMTDQFPHPYTEEKGSAFINNAAAGSPVHIFAIDINGEACGGIGLHPQSDVHCKNAELGYWLAEPFWGKGIIPQAIARIVDYGFKTFAIDRIFARPYGTNTASQRVLEKAGFVLEARFEKTIFKNGAYLDELIYATRRKTT
ncbi:MAG: hypothetical protein FD123_217 [Bacteroidetes bacterium]|nr:MAG: hypothetical protein FD123_217 [Bacteroidota bacterium]